MKIVYSLEPILDSENSIFLAGPSFRVDENQKYNIFDSNKSWRNLALDYLNLSGFSGTVYVPEFRNNKIPSDWSFSRQVSWEQKGLKTCKTVLFWIPRDKDKLPAFTTNIEFGLMFTSNKIVIGSPPNTYKNRYLEELCSQNNIKWHYSLENTINEALSMINKKNEGKIWFISDTHFNEERTMLLSKRPFKTIVEMDWSLIKNWNTNITDKDIVYHLGDIGNPKYLQHLNGKEINIILGNYDKEDIVNVLKQDSRVKILEEGHSVNLKNQEYSLVHYPSSMLKDLNKFYLFGHVHSLIKVKINGLNVGVDCHNYEPIDLETVEFYRTAIEKYYDSEVFPEI